MAWEQPEFSLSFVASKDLSSYQFEAVRLTTALTISNITSATSPIVGVLQDKPTSGVVGNVMVIGVSKIRAGGAFGRGAKIKVNAVATSVGGRFVDGTTSATGYTAISKEAAATSGDIVTAIINFNV